MASPQQHRPSSRSGNASGTKSVAVPLSPSDPRNNVYIRNLDARVSAEELRQIFEHFGEVQSHKLMVDIKTGASRGFGFVMYTHAVDAAAAVQALEGFEVYGNKIQVRLADSKTRPPGEPTRKLFLRNLPPAFSQTDVEQLCGPCGVVTSCVVRPDERHAQVCANGGLTLVAHVEMDTVDASQRVVDALNNSTMYCPLVPSALLAKVVDLGKQISAHHTAHSTTAPGAVEPTKQQQQQQQQPLVGDRRRSFMTPPSAGIPTSPYRHQHPPAPPSTLPMVTVGVRPSPVLMPAAGMQPPPLSLPSPITGPLALPSNASFVSYDHSGSHFMGDSFGHPAPAPWYPPHQLHRQAQFMTLTPPTASTPLQPTLSFMTGPHGPQFMYLESGPPSGGAYNAPATTYQTLPPYMPPPPPPPPPDTRGGVLPASGHRFPPYGGHQ